MTVRPATLEDVDAIAASEADNLGADAWSLALVEEGVAGRLPTVHYRVVEEDGRVVGHAVASVVDDVARGPTGSSSRFARTTSRHWRSTPGTGSSRSTGGAATTATALPRWCSCARSAGFAVPAQWGRD